MKRVCVVVVALATLPLAGCVQFSGDVTGVQKDVVGAVEVDFTLCASGNDDADSTPAEQAADDHPGCTGGTTAFSPADDVQVLVFFYVPAGTTAPNSFNTINGTGPELTFTRNTQFEQALAEQSPPNPGQQVVGYVSGLYDFDDGADEVPAQMGTFEVDLTPPHTSGSPPFQGPFEATVRAGFRDVADPSEPFDCTPFPDSDQNCFDGLASLEVATRDLGIMPGAPVTAAAGSSATLQFDARFSGAVDPAASFALSADSSVPQSTATPSASNLTPAADSSNPVSVAVTVPSATPAGTYDVELFAKLVNGQERSGIAKLTVTPDVSVPSAQQLELDPSSFLPFQGRGASIAAAKRGAKLSYVLSERATVLFTVERARAGARKGRRCVKRKRGDKRPRCKRFKKLKGSFSRGSAAGENSFRFTGRLNRKPLKPGTYRLTGVPTDPVGNRGQAVQARFKIRARR